MKSLLDYEISPVKRHVEFREGEIRWSVKLGEAVLCSGSYDYCTEMVLHRKALAKISNEVN